MAIYKLGDLFRVSDGEHGNVLFGQFSIPFIRVKDFDNLPNTDKFISEKEFDRINKRTDLRKNDILLSSVGTIGEVRLNNWDKIGLARSIITIRTRDEGRALTKFLFYILKTKFVELNSLAKGSAQKVLSLSDVRKLDIDVPSLEQQKQIIDIIEPIENIETMLNQLLQIIINSETELFHKIKNESKEKTKRHNLVLEIKEKSKSELVTVVGVGYNGFTKKSGNISPFSKVVSKGEIAIGLISKDIPIGFNWTNSKFGISSIYKVIGSRNKNLPMLSWYVALDITDNWKNYIASTARQGQGFNITSFLNDEIHNPDNSKINEYNQTVINILDVKERIKQHIEDVKKQKEKVINYLLK